MKALSILMSLLIVSALSMDLPAAATEGNTFKEEELDQMLAPIALYPDSLLAQVLMADDPPQSDAARLHYRKALELGEPPDEAIGKTLGITTEE